ncbi:MAG: S-methyl-5-thioribose-1-phosphate isomerase [Candidatus Obscuribacter sp.]|nr:S-methyl-5-thioribose-1-phosphate isomerase [Candidatus Obscuribacter sp.]MBK9279792.1 S-methyl-5-thioribose-1-phosphate isomerase [Candidatus Obscuribacter sp.]MBL8082586.1 S-methyl-5-thioribose-1-phosphate isomerase [Candidatus Obscuribacter sp.]
MAGLESGLLPFEFDGHRLSLIDQRALPFSEVYFDATEFDNLLYAVREMVVRGAPSIGAVAAFGHALTVKRHGGDWSKIEADREKLLSTRPTAVNLKFAVDKVHEAARSALAQGPQCSADAAMAEARRLLSELVDANRSMSEHGLELVPAGAGILTHCNAGPLAACGYGTALGVIRSAHFAGRNISVFVDETRPRNQGARLTLFELMRDQVPCTLVCETMTSYLMSSGKVDLVITGADRIARNGDTANKIGTYNLAILARHFGLPFYIAAPLSTFDAHTAEGSDIPIEMRDQAEVLTLDGQPHTPAGAKALNPSFDVTPAELITAIITEKGILRAPYKPAIEAYLKSQYSMA